MQYKNPKTTTIIIIREYQSMKKEKERWFRINLIIKKKIRKKWLSINPISKKKVRKSRFRINPISKKKAKVLKIFPYLMTLWKMRKGII